MEHLIAFASGIGIAIASSVPVGPINFAIFHEVCNKQKRSAFLIGIGGMIADVVISYLALALYGWLAEGDNSEFFHWLNILTIPVVMIFGIMMIKNRNKEAKANKKMPASSGILLGLTLGLSNPVLLGYWLVIAAQVMGSGLVKRSFLSYLSFTLGVGIGISAFFIGFIYLLAFGTKKLSDKYRSIFSLLIGIGFIGFGIFQLIWLLIN
jgi:threonine/homoserine/homoserine lactone efflux protein